MTGVAAALLLVNQLVGRPANRTAWWEYEFKVERASTPGDSPELVSVARRAEFEKRFQAVVTALNRFSRKYNESRGQIWPLKEAAEVARAYRDLQRLERSFEDAKGPR